MNRSIAAMALLVWGFGLAAPAQPVPVGSMAPAPVLLTLSGDSYKFLSDLYYEGEDRPGARRSAVALIFMGQHSAPSAEALPLFMEVARKVHAHEALRGKARFFLVDVDPLGEKSRLPAFLARHRVGLPVDVLLDPAQKAGKQFGVEALPRTFVISRDGVLVGDIEGAGGDYSKALATAVVRAIRAAGSNPVRADRRLSSPGRPDAGGEREGNPSQPMQW
ncbi:MAG: TlpA family protein disulfide reductase [Kiritimatiellia bacterium]